MARKQGLRSTITSVEALSLTLPSSMVVRRRRSVAALFCLSNVGILIWYLHKFSSVKSVFPSNLDAILASAIPDYLPVGTHIHLDDQRFQQSILCSALSAPPLFQNRGQTAAKDPCWTAPTSELGPISAADLCQLHAKKRILLVGPELTYHLHLLWLAALSEHDHQSHECRGSEFCTFHHVCQSLHNDEDRRNQRHQTMPSNNELSTFNSSLIRFVMSTSLYTSSDAEDEHYTVPQIDAETGVRVRDMPWISKAKKSDIVILHRAPLPAPAFTHDGTKRGNWSFVDAFERLVPDRIVNAALHTTLNRFLPALNDTLTTLNAQAEFHKKDIFWIWHGGLYKPCTSSSSYLNPQAFASSSNNWQLYLNAQSYMHDYLLPKILPHYRILYVPLVSLSSDNSKKCPVPSYDTPSGKALLKHFSSALGAKLVL
ncbi:hypothetical protein CYLTODRAFT_21173 [Cylindrobasidium torrendii FP15055 ss-10]|uniref:Uncharacterized protein n=1 Tax=Cylindrobasidium torrendii FP15055 ss-10 TaxID=1314674 RepID=A0A0D7B8X4_9AGAR|nr:hypothetical protein CYLTODRAFT_21173 [Cylindrobasidium torrendii FP15055 ss-10]